MHELRHFQNVYQLTNSSIIFKCTSCIAFYTLITYISYITLKIIQLALINVIIILIRAALHMFFIFTNNFFSITQLKQ